MVLFIKVSIYFNILNIDCGFLSAAFLFCGRYFKVIMRFVCLPGSKEVHRVAGWPVFVARPSGGTQAPAEMSHLYSKLELTLTACERVPWLAGASITQIPEWASSTASLFSHRLEARSGDQGVRVCI